MNTNRLPLLVALLVAGFGSLGAQGTGTNQWELFESLDWTNRLNYLSSGNPNNWTPEFLLKALEATDDARIETGSDNEVHTKRELAIQVVKILADRKVTQGAGAIARLPGQYRDARLRGEAWLALARLGDRSQLAPMVRTLTALNESAQRGRSEEVLASYLLQALGTLGAPEAFRAVAATTQGWYTPASGVRALAKKTLTQLAPDVEKAMDELLATEENLGLVEGLYQSIVDQGDVERSTRAAAALLPALVRLVPRDKEDSDRAYRLVLLALTTSQKSASPPVTLVAPAQVLITKNDNTQQMILAVQILGHIDHPSALDALKALLRKYNSQQKSGTNKPRDTTVARETMYALAQLRKPAVRDPLEEALYSDYSPAIARELTDMLERIPRE